MTQNKQLISVIETGRKQNEADRDGYNKQKKQFENKNNGKIPAYLKRFRAEEERERQETLKEIEFNKRPEGTRLVPQQERDKVRRDLLDRKQQLSEGIEKMSVTLYTTRAQN